MVRSAWWMAMALAVVCVTGCGGGGPNPACENDQDCDDSDACTTDSCADGQCSHSALDCDDGDACTTDACADGQCSHSALDCDDGDACTTDACADGQCSHSALDCDDANACTGDACDPATGQCTHDLLPACSQCSMAQAIDCDAGATGDTAAAGAALIDSYSCYAASLPGPELVFPFTAATAQRVRFRVAGTAGFNPALLALGGQCDPSQCLGFTAPAEAGNELELQLDAGQTIFLVVDGDAGQAGGFDLSVTCGPGPQTESDCTDGVDDDLDGATDCADPDCQAAGDPCAATEEGPLCLDGLDNDGDGATDCADPDCQGAGGPCEEFEHGPTCLDGIDNDGDGATDCDDPDCEQLQECQGGGPETICDDGLDNDFDGEADCRDQDCLDAAGTPGNPCELVEATCDDNRDNDGDGLRDCFDPDCLGQAGGPAGQPCEAVELSCADGFDNDADGIEDCGDEDCRQSPQCPDCTFSAQLACGASITANTETDGASVVDWYVCDGNTQNLPGLELAYEFVAPDDLTLEVSVHTPGEFPEPGREITLMALEGGCDPFACLGQAMPFGPDGATLTVAAQAGVSYGLMVDSYELGGEFSLELTCREQPHCADGRDNDADGLTDCDDPDCAGAAGCFCAPAVEVVGCDWVQTADPPGGPGARDQYACGQLWAYPGSEAIYAFTAPVSGAVQASVVSESSNALILLDGTCAPDDPDACLASTSGLFRTQLTFDAVAGETYYLVVERSEGPDPAPFDLSIVCQGDEVCDDGLDNDLDGQTDCADSDCTGVPVGPQGQACELPEASCADGFDNDGDGMADCQSYTCDGLVGPDGGICEPGGEDSCADGFDNDGNGQVDCQDFHCMYAAGCYEWNCYDGVDDDGDGTTDCADNDCWDWTMARECHEQNCDDGIDNDYNPFFNAGGQIDCQDPDCAGSLACTEVDCADGLDGDGDGLTDCEDPVCNSDPACRDWPCDDGVDSDNDGLTDCDDPDCEWDFACYEIECEDGLDNDGDGLTDCQDPNCREPQPDACWERVCDDGLDDDYDGATDCADDDCTGQPACVESLCGDGVDNDGDGATDCADPDCGPFPGCLCRAPLLLSGCGDTAMGDLSGGADAVSAYACSYQNLDGPELVYELQADQAGPIVIRARDPIFPSFAMVLLDDTCTPASPDSCLTSTQSGGNGWMPPVWAEPGEQFELVVESAAWAPGPSLAYALDVICPTDTCTPDETIACGQSLSGDLTSGASRLDDLCGFYLTGPDRIYAFNSPDDVDVQVTLIPLPGSAAYLALLLGVCDSQACLAVDSQGEMPTQITFAATAGRQYYLAADSADWMDRGPYQLSVSCTPR